MTTSPPPLKLVGAVGSPYSRKLRSVLRYRRIPYHWVSATAPGASQQDLPKPPLPLLPALYFPKDGGYEATSDTTFQIRRLESEFAERCIVPSDPVLAFLDFLIEDYGDEWATKMMFHYRWAIQENVDNANKMLPRWNLAVPEELAQTFPTTFGQRQVDRLGVVGSNQETGPIIEGSYLRLLRLLEQHFRTHKFVMGDRPGTADFGLAGQLSQLVQVEPTSQALARAEAPRVVAWVDVMEDLSGLEVSDRDWIAREDLHDLLVEIGRTYAPFLLANAAALESGAEQVQGRIDGARWTQTPFKYQGKCLTWLREAYAELAAADRAGVDEALKETGCQQLF